MKTDDTRNDNAYRHDKVEYPLHDQWHGLACAIAMTVLCLVVLIVCLAWWFGVMPDIASAATFCVSLCLLACSIHLFRWRAAWRVGLPWTHGSRDQRVVARLLASQWMATTSMVWDPWRDRVTGVWWRPSLRNVAVEGETALVLEIQLPLDVMVSPSVLRSPIDDGLLAQVLGIPSAELIQRTGDLVWIRVICVDATKKVRRADSAPNDSAPNW